MFYYFNSLSRNSEGVKAILSAAVPTNVNEVWSFRGFTNYYGKFVHDMATTLYFLYQLLRKDV